MKRRKTVKETVKKLAVNRELRPREREVLGLMVSEGLRTPRQVAARLRIHPRTARQYIKTLRDAGLLNICGEPMGGVSGESGERKGRVRLHAVQFKAGIIGGVCRPRVIPRVLGWRVVVNRSCVEFYGGGGCWFGRDESEAFGRCLDDVVRCAHRVSHDLRVILVKPRRNNWELVRAEWATEDSEVAREHEVRGVRLEVRGVEDGRVWLWGDWSKKEPEHETRDKEDSEAVARRLNDWRENDPPTDSELYGMVGRLLSYQEQTQKQLRDVSATVNFLMRRLKQSEDGDVPGESRGRPYYVG